jgi:hypothetical protein
MLEIVVFEENMIALESLEELVEMFMEENVIS